MTETAQRHKRGGLYFDDFVVGTLYEHRLTRTVTQMDNMLFSNMTLNPQPLHIDRHFCEQETEWGQPLMNSLFTLGLMIGISVNDITIGTTIANLGMTDVRFPHPLFERRHRALHDRDRRQARIEVAPRRRHRRTASLRLQAGRHAGRRMPPPGLHPHAAKLNVRCALLLFVPADSPASSTRPDQRRRRDDRRPGRFDRARRQGRSRAQPRSPSWRGGHAAERAAPACAHQRARHRLADDDLDAVVRAAPDGILLPKAEGGASVAHLDAKLAVREARNGLAGRPTLILAHTTETAEGLVSRRHLSRRARAAASPGARRTCRPSSARRPIAMPTAVYSPYRLARIALPCRRGGRAGAGDRHRLCRFPQQAGLRRE